MRYWRTKVEARFTARIVDVEGDVDGPACTGEKVNAAPSCASPEPDEPCGARICAMAVLTALTTTLCWAVLGYAEVASPQEEAVAARVVFHARIAQAADEARAHGDFAFAEWLDELP
jgi:hypothetical protein